MRQLSGLDATFLYLETPQTPMHVGSLHLYELPAGFKGSFHAQVKKHMAGRIHLSPIFTRKLVFMPFNLGHPQWVDDENFDLDQHIIKIGKTVKDKAGKPIAITETMAQDMAAALHGELIDRARPLWVFYVFDSVLRNDGLLCTAFYSKIHHAALDGKGGTVLANAVLDVSAVPREVPPPDPAHKRKAADLKVGEMIGAVFSNSLAQYAKLAKSLPAAATQIGGSLAKNSMGGKGEGKLKAKSPLSLAPKTPFNVGIGADRVFVTASLPFAQCRAMAKSINASFNDIVLWICSTALRTYLAQHASVPKKPLIAAMPVSLRDDSNKDMGNQASMSLANLGTHIAHPGKRMQAIMASTGKVKEALVNLKSVLPTDYPGLLAPWVVGGAARLALKAYGSAGVAERLPLLANVVISNVPGPQVPLYLAGARMLTFHPLSIVMHGLGLNITVQTYAGRVDFGIIAGKNALPHAQDLADAIAIAFEEAQRLYAMGQTPVVVSHKTQKSGATSKVTRQKAATLTPKRRSTSARPPVKKTTQNS